MSDTSTPPPPPRPTNLAATLVLVIIGVATMTMRQFDNGIGTWLSTYASFGRLPADTVRHVDDLLLLPAAAVIVVFVRVTLGMRMLGPFRPVLIALAFYQTGVVPGVLFMLAVMAIVVALRPRLGSGMLPYFGRLTVLLSVVVIVDLVVLLVGTHIGSSDMVDAAVFPIIVLCLSADGFARVMARDGTKSAIARGTTTMVLAAAISTLGNLDAVADFLFAFPEFILVEIAAIIVISTRMKWQLLEQQNASSTAE